MKRILRLIPLLTITLVTGAVSSSGQSADYTAGPDSKMWIDGTSNKSDWTVTAAAVSGRATLATDGTVESVQVTVPAKEIVSGRSTIMDRLMYRALKVTEHPEITYAFEAGEPSGDSLATRGDLTIAGVTREAVFNVAAAPGEGSAVRFAGSYTLKMTDFDMKPPTAMFGALHTADEITVHFDVQFVPTTAGTSEM